LVPNTNDDGAILSYQEASTRFRIAYQLYREYRETVILETKAMFDALKVAGYTNKAAINKIAEDHKDLKGFSERTIYRNLPAEVKDPSQRGKRLGYQNSVAKNTDFGNPPEITGEHSFNTQGMGVAITDEEDTEEDQQRSKPIPNNDALIARIDTLQRENAALKKEIVKAENKIQEQQNEIEFLKSSLIEQEPNQELPKDQQKDWLLSK
jgi:hypothetical protein